MGVSEWAKAFAERKARRQGLGPYIHREDLGRYLDEARLDGAQKILEMVVNQLNRIRDSEGRHHSVTTRIGRIGLLTELLGTLEEYNCRRILLQDPVAQKADYTDPCDVCGGKGVGLSSTPCACGGSGLLIDALTYVRSEVLKVEKERDRYRKQVDTGDGHVGWSSKLLDEIERRALMSVRDAAERVKKLELIDSKLDKLEKRLGGGESASDYESRVRSWQRMAHIALQALERARPTEAYDILAGMLDQDGAPEAEEHAITDSRKIVERALGSDFAAWTGLDVKEIFNYQQSNALDVVKWLLSVSPDDRRTGRTLVMAFVTLRMALGNPGMPIRIVDHYGTHTARSNMAKEVRALISRGLRNKPGEDNPLFHVSVNADQVVYSLPKYKPIDQPPPRKIE